MSIKLHIARDFEEMSRLAFEIAEARIVQLEKEKDEIVLGLATGNSPTGLYKRLAAAANQGRIDSGRWRTFNLDEYVGLPGDNSEMRKRHPESYHRFMEVEFFQHLKREPIETVVPEGNLVELAELTKNLGEHPAGWERKGTLSGNAIVIQDHCQSSYLCWLRREILDSYASRISQSGGVDLQVSGVGGRGHVAFHEAGIPFDLRGLLLVELDEVTRQHSVEDGHFESLEEAPRFALTMSVDLVFKARSVLVLANGERKREAITRSLLEEPTSEMPLSCVQVYARGGGEAIFVLDEIAASGLLERRSELDQRGIVTEEISH